MKQSWHWNYKIWNRQKKNYARLVLDKLIKITNSSKTDVKHNWIFQREENLKVINLKDFEPIDKFLLKNSNIKLILTKI